MAKYFTQTYRDYDGTRQQTSIAVSATAVNADITAIHNAFLAIAIGAPDGLEFTDILVPSTGAAATSQFAQTSLQLILEMSETASGKIYRERFPMPDLAVSGAFIRTGQGVNSKTILDMTSPEATTLKAALDAVWVSPNGLVGTMVGAYVES